MSIFDSDSVTMDTEICTLESARNIIRRLRLGHKVPKAGLESYVVKNTAIETVRKALEEKEEWEEMWILQRIRKEESAYIRVGLLKNHSEQYQTMANDILNKIKEFTCLVY